MLPPLLNRENTIVATANASLCKALCIYHWIEKIEKNGKSMSVVIPVHKMQLTILIRSVDEFLSDMCSPPGAEQNGPPQDGAFSIFISKELVSTDEA